MQLTSWTEVGLDTAHEVLTAVEQADGVPFGTTRGEVDEWIEEPHFDPSSDTVVAVVEGRAVGYAAASHAPAGERLERVHLWGGVLPAYRGRGIGSALLEWQLARGREQLAEVDPDLPRYIRTWEYDFRSGSHRLFEDHGMVPVRWFEELIRPVSALEAAADVEVLPWDPKLHSELVRLLKNDVFTDHWGSTPTDEGTWAVWMGAENTRLDLSFVAMDDGELVGFALNGVYPADEAITGRKDGWVESLGVARTHRKQGVASALLATSVSAFADAGRSHAMLGVDSANPTGARGLYVRLGFEPIHRAVSHELRVD